MAGLAVFAVGKSKELAPAFASQSVHVSVHGVAAVPDRLLENMTNGSGELFQTVYGNFPRRTKRQDARPEERLRHINISQA